MHTMYAIKEQHKKITKVAATAAAAAPIQMTMTMRTRKAHTSKLVWVYTLSITLLTLLSARLNYAIAIKIKRTKDGKPCAKPHHARQTSIPPNGTGFKENGHILQHFEIIIMMCKLNDR